VHEPRLCALERKTLLYYYIILCYSILIHMVIEIPLFLRGAFLMKLVDIKIENFRGIQSLHLPLDDLTVLIGENNTGKSTVLEALKLLLGRGYGARRSGFFSEYDFHLRDATATPHTAHPIKIILHFAEEKENEWPDPIIQQMAAVIQVDSTGLSHIWFRAEGIFDSGSSSFETKTSFLNAAGTELPLKNSTPFNLLPKFMPLFFLSALRDASQEFGQRGQFWNGFLKSIQLPEEEREKIEQMLQAVNTSVIGANAGLTEVTQRIGSACKLVPLNTTDPVVLEAIPTRVFDMVGKIQVHLKSTCGAKLPLNRHGEGTQSLAVLMLFQAFAAVSIAEAYEPESTPILALEEPEAHLHPAAIRSLGSFLEGLTGQVLVSSHSGDLISRVPITSIRRLCKNNRETKVGRVQQGQFNDRELQAINYSICINRGHYLFSRCWMLVEGESDFHIMPLLFERMGYFQDQLSFSVLEVSQVFEKGEPLIKFAKELGIQWFMMADGDGAGTNLINRARNHLEAGENIDDRARKLTCQDIEHEFWYNGYDVFITGLVPSRRIRQIKTISTGDAVKRVKLIVDAAIDEIGGKPAFAQKLAEEVERRGSTSIPQTIKDIIERVVFLAEG